MFRPWADVPPQHRATEALLTAMRPAPVWRKRNKYGKFFSWRRYTEGAPEEGPQCGAALLAVHAEWQSRWVPPDPDPRFTTEAYVKLYVRCPERLRVAGERFCPHHGGRKTTNSPP